MGKEEECVSEEVRGGCVGGVEKEVGRKGRDGEREVKDIWKRKKR